tara:strand:- start:6440 stop:7288 length:849 start_codon:yes stop_codon:yes gene_type:complete
MAQLRIKRSTGSTAPSSSNLANAELAFCEGDETLYIGKGTSGSNAASVVKIGGKGAYVDLTNAQTVAGDKTFSGNLAISGNLTVNGTTTTVNTTNTTVSDPLMELNSGASSNSNDCGILIERGSTGDNAFIGFDESTDKFTVGLTTDTANSTGNLSNFTTGTLVASLEGNVTGNASSATALQTGRTIAGVTFDGTQNISLNNNSITNGAGYITSSSNITGNAATATTATNITATANNSTSETVYLTFIDGQTGAQGIESDTDLSYNPSTGVLSVGQIDGGTF